MKLFDVYPLFPIEPVKASGSWLWDVNNKKYLDLYGGHAVISIGHNHPHFVARLTEQLHKISFYSNSVKNTLQEELADKLGQLSGYPTYQLFLCNSGAEANENAIKLASFVTGRKKVIAFQKAFHGRTSGAVAVTDNKKIVAPFNAVHEVIFLPLNDVAALHQHIDETVAAVLIEGIQGVGGIYIPEASFLQQLSAICKKNGTLLIADEVQSGYGRTGKFFAHQHADSQPDLITVAKGMGNGFPIGGVLIHPSIQPWSGMLGTTFGGNYLACAAALAVLEVIEKENLMHHAQKIGNEILERLKASQYFEDVRGKGLMIGFDLPQPLLHLRNTLLTEHSIFTGEAKPNTIRLLPSLALTKEDVAYFFSALEKETSKH
ncbi:MAG: aminotransferase class III-fold pyridoxal phosphate-dependent enzyme [Cyclobacteriaceae bacterium]|jgi:acetylornithine/N-succinyldiaminopimelate aminotransferase|nr:aminotransferase class III-fold pyridoxal phosphate-dependent enzyme [Cytophagales bacterium]MCZ8328343.1 aminotransferase class III-fold pyridoxal phosphate-dependent enzyme [Cyclobacteriaceae bacterium]